MKILIVEDQKGPLETLEFTVNKVMPTYFFDFTQNDYDVAKCYNDAQRRISDQDYELVLLDNRIPYEDQGDLEDVNMNKFSASLENIGYSLIPIIKRRN